MAVTEEFREQVLEVLNDTGYNAEAEEQIITSLEDLDEDTTIPGIKRVDGALQSYTMLALPVIKDYIDDKTGTPIANANAAATAANTAAGAANTATTNANTATAGAEKVNALLSTSGGAVILTVTDRNNNSVSREVGFRIAKTYASVAAMNADAAHVDEGRFVMVASEVEPENGQLYVRNAATAETAFTLIADLSGAQGIKGDTGTIAVGTVVKVPVGQQPYVTNVGSNTEAVFNFGLPQGEKGEAAVISKVRAVTGAAGSDAQVSNEGNIYDAKFVFTIPRGDKGDKGEGINMATMTAAEKDDLYKKVLQQVSSENILGPTYDASHRCIEYPITNGVKYDEANRCIKLG